MQDSPLFMGVDVSKAGLVIATSAAQRLRSIANDALSIGRWLRQVPSHALLAMESTGRAGLASTAVVGTLVPDALGGAAAPAAAA